MSECGSTLPSVGVDRIVVIKYEHAFSSSSYQTVGGGSQISLEMSGFCEDCSTVYSSMHMFMATQSLPVCGVETMSCFVLFVCLFARSAFSSLISCAFLVFLVFCVAEVLKKGSSVHPDLLRRETMAVREKQRTTFYCDQLLQHISSLAP